MSTPEYHFDIDPTRAEMRAANRLARRLMFPGIWGLLLLVRGLFFGITALIVVGTLLIVLGNLGGLENEKILGLWPVAAVFLFLPLQWLDRWRHISLQQDALWSQGRIATIGRDGVLTESDHFRVQVDWSAIHGISRGNSVIVGVYGNMFLPFPTRGFGVQIDQAFSDMKQWHEAAQ